MSCSNWRVEVSALLDGQLDSRAEQRLRTHLEDCGECSAFYREMVASNNVFVQACQWRIIPSDSLWTRLEARLPSAEPEVHWTARLAALLTPRYGYATAVAVLLVSLLFVAQRQENLARQSLAALDAYQLEVEGNPFFVEPSNPAVTGVNPFQQE